MQLLIAMLLLVSLGLLVWILQLRTRLAKLETQAKVLAESVGALPVAARDPTGRPMLLTIEILNAVELARKESWFAGAFGSLTPALLKRIVYTRTRTIMQQQLLQFDVKADVQLLGDG